jgi:hypothetical protein
MRLAPASRSPVSERDGRCRGERLSFQVFHHQEFDAVVRAHVVERADVRVIQRRNGSRFAFEAFAEGGIGGEGRGQDLDGDRSIEARIAGAIDVARPPSPSFSMTRYGPTR